MPRGFTKNYDHGLGLAKPYRFIVQAAESLGPCEEIAISESAATMIDDERGVFWLSTSDFEHLRKTLDRITSHSQHAAISVKEADTYNFLAEKIGVPTVSAEMGRHTMRKLFTAFLESRGHALLTDEAQEELLAAMSGSAKAISETKPEQLIRLQNDIELVNLTGLIGAFKQMLQDGHRESGWQRFFSANPIILSMGFGYPVITVGGDASVGGRKLSGGGDKIADFLVKNSMTNNAAIVEIKTPSTKLLNEGSYREGVFVPSRELVGGMNQVLDQKLALEKEIAGIKERSRIRDLETYRVQGCLIVGMMPRGFDRQKSFEMFRNNSKDVSIVTFDELLERLRSLERFLTSSGKEIHDDDLPF